MLRTLIMAAAFFWNTIAHGSEAYFAPGHSVKSQGMGGVGIALPLDSLSAAANPAGAAFLADRIDFGLAHLAPDSSTQIVRNIYPNDKRAYFANGRDDSSIPEFGFIKTVSPHLTVGLAVRRNSMSTQYNQYRKGDFNTPYAHVLSGDIGYRFDNLLISPSLTYRVNENNAFGIALNFSRLRVETNGLQEAYTTVASANAIPLPRPSGNATHSASGKGIRLGWMGVIAPNLTMGATWATKTAANDFGSEGSLFQNGGHFDLPADVGIGFAYQVAPDWTLAFDVSRIKYGSVNRGATVVGYDVLASPNLPGSGWKHAARFKLGVSHRLSSETILRAGYSYSDNAIPSHRAYYNILFPAVVRHRLSFGASWKSSGNGELSATLVHGFKQTIEGVDSLTNIPAYLFGGGSAYLSAKETSFGLAYGWNF